MGAKPVSAATLKRNSVALRDAARRVFRGGPNAGKVEFLRSGRAVANNIRSLLGVEADVRVNPGGPAVVGEAVLHTDNVYVQFCGSGPFGDSPKFLYRTCNGRKDYCGGGNRWYSYESLADAPDKFVGILRTLVK